MKGDDVIFGSATILYPENMKRGRRFAVGHGAWINAAGGLTIGDDVLIAPYVCICTSNHRFDRTDVPIVEQGNRHEPVVIGCDVWIGAHAVVCPGAVVGNHVVVAAGAVVTGVVPDYAVVAGVPARVVRMRR